MRARAHFVVSLAVMPEYDADVTFRYQIEL